MINRVSPPLVVMFTAAFLVVTAVLLGSRLLRGDRSLLRNVSVQDDHISPNADGQQDATIVAYEISRNATVSIYFEDEAGERFYFRRDKARGADSYRVLFSGVVEGYRLPGETIQGEILARLLQDGDYTWTIEATDVKGVMEMAMGQLTITDADSILPEMRNFHLDRRVFSPNRDGVDDRVRPQFDLVKEVEELRVFLLMPDGREVPVTETVRDVDVRQPGYHQYDYEGGVDNGATPPLDGTYPVVAVARDLEGQKIRVEDELTIQFGGVPRADVLAPPSGDTLRFDATAVALCDVIHFELTIRNYGDTPIRTSGPAPGTTYDSDWNYNTLGWHTESGVFRVGIGFENELTNYPYRWAVGNPNDLVEIDGYHYLMPGELAVVTGGIRVVDVFGDRNPQPMWAGLIHEDVEVSQFNSRVDPHAILVDIPDPDNVEPCAAREIPARVAD